MDKIDSHLNRVKTMFLKEVRDNPDSPLCKLVGNRDVFKFIFDGIRNEYAEKSKYITKCHNAYMICRSYYIDYKKNHQFPPGTDIDINMMPIDLLNVTKTLPPFLKGYDELIWKCVNLQSGGWGMNKRIGYLTIQEGWVDPGKTQRRPGLHIESPLGKGTIFEKPDYKKVGADSFYNSKWHAISWGNGIYDGDQHQDGIYMASNVDDMAKIYPYLIEKSEKVTDRHGGLEDIKDLFQDGELMKKNTLYWLTDRTPHESLPNPTDKPVYRQFFRLVMGPIGAWYTQHNTPNPLGIEPDAPIIKENKFI